MTDINLRVPDSLKKQFEFRIGKGNMSQVLRSYMEAVISGSETIDEQILQQEVNILEKQKQELDAKYQEKKSLLDSMMQQKEIATLEALKREKEMKDKFSQMKMDTMVKHLGSMIK